MPPSNARLSVYSTTGLSEQEIWQIANNHVVPGRGKPALGRADLNSLVVYGENLAVELAPGPHPRHADIAGWDMAGTSARLQAIKLAAAATLIGLPHM